jgi:hypothetical protein
MRVDLHIHSTASDGCWPPQELVAQVKRAGMGLFAVADHDTVASVLPVERLVQDKSVRCLPLQQWTSPGFVRAVEVSATLDGLKIHLLGYGIDLDDPALLHMLDENWQKLKSVDDQSIHKLIAAGYDLTWEEYHAYQNDVTRGGWKALNFMIDKGFCQDVRDFFGRLFVGDMALSYPSFAPPDQAVRAIHQAGGLAIWAHPGDNAQAEWETLAEKLLDCGIDGLECYSPYHDGTATRRCLDLSWRHGLLVTAGSDCHGGFAGRALGVPEVDSSELNLGRLLDCVRF